MVGAQEGSFIIICVILLIVGGFVVDWAKKYYKKQ